MRGRLELNLVSAVYGNVIYAVLAAKAEGCVCSGSWASQVDKVED